MSVVQGGLAFPAPRPIDDFADLLGRLFSDTVEELELPLQQPFDVRKPGDVMLLSYGDACFVCNLDLGLQALQEPGVQGSRMHALLGKPGTMLAYCHDDAGARHGYALFDAGRLVRSRLQVPRAGPAGSGDVKVLEYGAAQPFERRWLTAPHFVERPEGPSVPSRRVFYLGDREILVPEADVTSRLLHDVLEARLGVCPWDTLITPTYRFFRALGRDEPYEFDAERVTQPKKRAWWRP